MTTGRINQVCSIRTARRTRRHADRARRPIYCKVDWHVRSCSTRRYIQDAPTRTATAAFLNCRSFFEIFLHMQSRVVHAQHNVTQHPSMDSRPRLATQHRIDAGSKQTSTKMAASCRDQGHMDRSQQTFRRVASYISAHCVSIHFSQTCPRRQQ